MLGFGRIGQQVARRALGLEMRVVAYDPFVSKDRFRELGAERVETPDEVLATADFLTLHLPLTAETRRSINAEAIGKMRDGVRIVNAARGELLDEGALLEALRSGKVAAAALDVFDTEPYSGPFLELDNVIVTPHLAASTEEAQDRAGLIVAEQVVAALEGSLVSNAVNIPSIGAEDLEILGPFIPLAATLGRLAMELAGGRAERIELAYYGSLSRFDTRLLTVAALNGAFQGRSDQPVNYVNAPVIAAERGIEVVEERRRASRDFTNLVRVSLKANGDELRVAGTTIGNEHRLWLVSALGFELEVELSPLMAIFRYDDLPGVIGRVGTLFGEAGINIANMAVSTNPEGREGSHGALARQPGATGARGVPPRRRAGRRVLHHASRLGGAARIESVREGADASELLDHAKAGAGSDDVLVFQNLVARRDEEVGSVGPRLLVVLERRRETLAALRVGALADDLGLVCADSLGGLRDPLVDVTEARLGLCDSQLFGSHPGVTRETEKRLAKFRLNLKNVARPWPEAVERVSSFLRQMGVEARIEEFETGTPTAVEAARAAGCKLGQIVKSLVFDCDGRWVVALVPGDRRADPTKIASAAGASKARIASPEQVERATASSRAPSRRSRSRGRPRLRRPRPARAQARLGRSRLAEPYGGAFAPPTSSASRGHNQWTPSRRPRNL